MTQDPLGPAYTQADLEKARLAVAQVVKAVNGEWLLSDQEAEGIAHLILPAVVAGLPMQGIQRQIHLILESRHDERHGP